MEYVFSIMMFVFGGALLLYAGLLALTKDYKLIARHYAAKVTDGKRYALCFARTIAIVAIAPIVSGVVGLFGIGWLNAVVAVVSFIACLVIGVKTFKV